MPAAYRRDGAAAVPPFTTQSAHARYRSISLPAEYRSHAPTPGGRQPISENFSPLGPANHSMCVAEVPMPSAVMTRCPSSRSSPYSGAVSIRLVAMNCGEIHRVRIASSTFG
jgi:hypothetical protein